MPYYSARLLPGSAPPPDQLSHRLILIMIGPSHLLTTAGMCLHTSDYPKETLSSTHQQWERKMSPSPSRAIDGINKCQRQLGKGLVRNAEGEGYCVTFQQSMLWKMFQSCYSEISRTATTPFHSLGHLLTKLPWKSHFVIVCLVLTSHGSELRMVAGLPQTSLRNCSLLAKCREKGGRGKLNIVLGNELPMPAPTWKSSAFPPPITQPILPLYSVLPIFTFLNVK